MRLLFGRVRRRFDFSMGSTARSVGEGLLVSLNL